MPKDSIYGVRLATWATNEKKGNGLKHFAQNRMLGGNIGHAAMSVTIPATEENKKLIEKYCIDPAIPYERQKVTTHKAELDENGQYKQTDQKLMEDDVYVINFSWWPDPKNDDGHKLTGSVNADGLSERSGVDVQWNEKFKDNFDIEQRVARGSLSSRLMTLGLTSVVHERNLNEKQKELLNTGAEIEINQRKINSLNVLDKKVTDYVSNLQRLEHLEQNILPNRNELMREHKQNASLLRDVSKQIGKGSLSLDNLSEKQTSYLQGKLSTNLNELDLSDKEQVSQVMKEIREARDQEKADFKVAKQATPESINKQKRQYENPGETMGLILDRLVPDWKDSVEGEKLNASNITALAERVDSAVMAADKKQDQLEDDFRHLRAEVLDSPVKKVKDLEQEIEDKQYELRDVRNQLFDEPDSEQLHRQFLELQRDVGNLESEKNDIKSSDDYKAFHLKNKQLEDWSDVIDQLDDLEFENGEAKISHTLSADLDASFNYGLGFDYDQCKKSEQHKREASCEWRNNHVSKKGGSFDTITEEEAQKLKEVAQEKMVQARKEILKYEQPKGNLTQSDFDNYYTLGKAPDHFISMPIEQTKPDGTVKNGLNVEDMLKEMKAIATSEKGFDQSLNNCSDTVGRVLEAGAQGPHLKSKFQNKALGAIGTPQVVFNGARDYLAALPSPEDSPAKKLGRFSPVRKAFGKRVQTLVDNKSTRGEMAGAVATGIPLGIATGSVAGIKGIGKGIGKLGTKIKGAFSKKPKYQNVEHVDMLHKDIAKGQEVESALKSAMEDQVKIVKGKTLDEALDNFRDELQNQKGPVAFDEKTLNMVEKKIGKIKDEGVREAYTAKLANLNQVSLTRVSEIQTNVLKDKEVIPADPARDQEMSSAASEVDLDASAAKPQDDLVKVKDAVYKEKEQFYSVMPILGEELAKQHESYAGYEPPRKPKSESDSDLPKTVDPEKISSNDGYLVAKQERDYITKMFHENPDLQEVKKGTPYPKGHPLEGQKTTCDAFKDNHDSIYVMNNGVLGKGGYGTVKVIQAIEAGDGQQAVKDKGFYAVKIQDVTEDNDLGALKKEMAMNEKFDMHFGDMVVKHDVMEKPPEYKLASEIKSDQPNIDAAEVDSIDPITGTVIKDDGPVTGTVIKDDGPVTGTVIKDDGPVTGTVIKDDGPVTGTVIKDDGPVTGTIIKDDGPVTGTVIKDDGPVTGTVIKDDGPVTGTIIKDDGPVTGTIIKDDGPVTGTIIKDDGPATGMIVKDDGPVTGMIVKEDGPVTGMVVKADGQTASKVDKSNNEPTALGFFANYKPKEMDMAEYAGLKPDLEDSSEDLDDEQGLKITDLAKEAEPPSVVKSEGNLKDINVLEYMEMFQKMSAEVEKVHDKGVIHRDIKAENFLYDKKSGDMKLIDFGISTTVGDKRTPYDFEEGSPQNFTPEAFHRDFKEPISTKQDMYALSRTFELLMFKDLQECNSNAYHNGLPTPAVPDHIRDDIEHVYMDNFRFKNDSNEPHAETLNQMLDLMSEMKSLDVNSRPEASAVKARLDSMINDYKAKMGIEDKVENELDSSVQAAPPGPANVVDAKEEDKYSDPVIEVSSEADEYDDALSQAAEERDEYSDPVIEVSSEADEYDDALSQAAEERDEYSDPVIEVSSEADEYDDALSQAAEERDEYSDPVIEVSSEADEYDDVLNDSVDEKAEQVKTKGAEATPPSLEDKLASLITEDAAPASKQKEAKKANGHELPELGGGNVAKLTSMFETKIAQEAKESQGKQLPKQSEPESTNTNQRKFK